MSMNYYKTRGFSLLEVLVTLVILAIGILGLAQLQVTTLKYNESAYLRTQASALAADIFDRMRANQKEVRTGAYNLSMSDSPPSGGSAAATDLADWLNNVAAFLPNGDGSISCAASPCESDAVVTVTLQWNEVQDDNGQERGLSTFVVEGAL